MGTDELTILLDRLLPEALEPLLRRVLGATVPRTGEGDRYRIESAGRFSGRLVGDLLSQVGNQECDGALVLMEHEVVRVLYFEEGTVVGAESNVLFERLGRILGQSGVVAEKDATDLIEEEERRGLTAVVSRLPDDVALWGLDRRVREVASALFLMPRGHHVLVAGRPALGRLPALRLSPTQLAVEGARRYDEWRNRSSTSGGAKAPAEPTLRVIREAMG